VYYKKFDETFTVVPIHVDKQFVKTTYQANTTKGGPILWQKPDT
jgi:hypothetical protein